MKRSELENHSNSVSRVICIDKNEPLPNDFKLTTISETLQEVFNEIKKE